MYRRPGFSIVALGLALFTVSATGNAAFSSASDGHVTFDAAGPAGFKIEGKTSEVSVSEVNGNVVITVALAHLTTGIDLRDSHMRDKYLEVPKFPTAVLTVARTALQLPAAGAQVEADAPATLTLHGTTRPVTVHYSSKSDGASCQTSGKLHINMNEYGITVPSYLGVTVKPEVDIVASFRAVGN
jgi:polyisoprenoid-binding protein YceI